jgi:two-component system chemotaxis family response regulator WspR
VANDYLVKLPDPIELIARIRYHSRTFLTAQRLENAHCALRVSQQQLLDTVLVLQRANNTLERLTNSDGLPDLANRRYFDSFLEVRWQSAVETCASYSGGRLH